MMIIRPSLLLFLLPTVLSFTVPVPTGPYPIGVIDVQLTDTSRRDAFNSSRYRDFALSLYYPSQKSSAPRRPYASLALQAIIEKDFNLPSGSLSNVTTNSVLFGLPRLPLPSTLLIFSPGFTDPRGEYTAIFEDLASHGYLVAAVDHPYDALGVELPLTGELIPASPLVNNVTDIPDLLPFYTQRVGDISHIVDQLASLPPPFNHLGATNLKIAMLGQSFGGATTLGAMARHGNIIAGLNMDGSLPFDTDKELKRPFMNLAQEGHYSETDESWAEVKASQTGVYRDWDMKGAGYMSYSDWGWLAAKEYLNLKETVGEDPRRDAYLGTIDGLRATKLYREWVKDWLQWTLTGKGGELVNGGSAVYPEMVRRA